jgi:hypothetical protein
MNLSRLTLGERVAAGSAIALLVFMFFPWFGGEQLVALPTGDISAPGDNKSAWGAFALIDLLLALIALVTLGIAASRALEIPLELPVPPALIVTGAGALAVVLIFYRIIDPPSLSSLGGDLVDVDIGRKIGLFLGLLAAFGIAAGGYVALEEQRSRRRTRSTAR